MLASMAFQELFEQARSQRGLFAIREAADVGVASLTLRRRVAQEGWPAPFPGIVALPGVDLDVPTLAFAAALATGPPAIVTGEVALQVQGMTSLAPVRPQLVIPAPDRAPKLDGVNIRRSRTLLPTDWSLDGGVPVATPARAFLDLAAMRSTDRLRSLLIDARQQRVVMPAEVAARASATIRAPGRGRLLRACADVLASGADSPLVKKVERGLSQAGIAFDVPPRTVRAADRKLHPDITLCGLPVALEVDGFGSHAERSDLEMDHRKHNAYLLAGWYVLRVSWHRVDHDWEGFLAQLRAAMDAARARA